MSLATHLDRGASKGALFFGCPQFLNVPNSESYLQIRAEQLDGEHYQFLLPLAETFASLARPLTASLLYRALLDSILRRARTTTYGHGARYLRKLDLLAKTISDWGDVEPHTVYVDKHGRKTSFLGRYER